MNKILVTSLIVLTFTISTACHAGLIKRKNNAANTQSEHLEDKAEQVRDESKELMHEAKKENDSYKRHEAEGLMDKSDELMQKSKQWDSQSVIDEKVEGIQVDAKNLTARGQAMIDEGKRENNPDKIYKGQQMVDQAKAKINEADNKMDQHERKESLDEAKQDTKDLKEKGQALLEEGKRESDFEKIKRGQEMINEARRNTTY